MLARSVVKLGTALLASGLAASALAGCDISIGTLQSRTSSYSVAGHVRALTVHDQAGAVHITGTDTSKVSVTEHMLFRHTAPATTHRLAAGTFTLNSSCPALETCSVSYDVTVPRSITVRVSDNVGTIRLDSLSGQVTAHTNAGDIDLAGVSGRIDVTGHAGTISGRGVASTHATLAMSAGAITVNFSVAPAVVTATTDVGSVTLRLPRNVAYAVNASAVVGSIKISVRRDRASRHVITASTKTGSVTVASAH
jgi:Putative adhesin